MFFFFCRLIFPYNYLFLLTADLLLKLLSFVSLFAISVFLSFSFVLSFSNRWRHKELPCNTSMLSSVKVSKLKFIFAKKLNLLFCKISRLKLFVTPELNSPLNRISKMRFSNSPNPTFASNKPNNLKFIILRFSTNRGSVQGRLILFLGNCQLVKSRLSGKLSEFCFCSSGFGQSF